MTLLKNFEVAVNDVTILKKSPTDNEKLKLYGLYKQATIGNINISKPSMFDLKGKSKYNAWEENKGMSDTTAMSEYVRYVSELQKIYN